jgi:NAD(P)H-hydrate epimerase
VLAGTIAALACHLDPFEAAFAGVHLHGLAAEAWTRDHGDRGLLAHEIADRYPRVLAALSASHADCPA